MGSGKQQQTNTQRRGGRRPAAERSNKVPSAAITQPHATPSSPRSPASPSHSPTTSPRSPSRSPSPPPRSTARAARGTAATTPAVITEKPRHHAMVLSPVSAHHFTGLFFTLKGGIMDMATATPHEIAANIELLDPLIRPYGCGPMAPTTWVVLRTYQKIVEWRDEIRMDEKGAVIGDRSFKCAYQTCMRNMVRYKALSTAEQKTATDAGWKGYRPTPDDPMFLGPIRAPTFCIEHTFRSVMDKFWHRYLLPFGCFAYEKNTLTGAGWNDWRDHHISSKGAGQHMNPCAVTAADILYLCSTDGYLDRFVYIVGIINWARSMGVNILRHVSPPPRDANTDQYDRFMTMDKHIHLFGSIYMHRKVIEINSPMIFNATEQIALLTHLQDKIYANFGLNKNTLNRDLDNMIVTEPSGRVSLSNVQQFFPNTMRVGSPDAKK